MCQTMDKILFLSRIIDINIVLSKYNSKNSLKLTIYSHNTLNVCPTDWASREHQSTVPAGMMMLAGKQHTVFGI